MIVILIPGIPIAKKRPRFARVGKFVRTYDSQETEEGRFLFEVKDQWRKPPIESDLDVRLHFCMPIPKGTSNKKYSLMLADQIRHTKKPDLSNLIKFVEDCCNGVVWKDDSQITKLFAKKFYGKEPKTIIEIVET